MAAKDESQFQNRPSPRLTWKKKVAFASAVFVVCLLLGEALLRVRHRLLSGVWGVPSYLQSASDVGVWHPFLRQVPRPGTRYRASGVNESAIVEINSLGFRSPETTAVKPPNRFRCVCVGGSVVYDTRVNLENSWPMQLENLLRQKYGDRVEVVNAGLPGRTTADSLVNVALRVLPLDPDVVILLEGINDQKPNRYPDFRPDYSHWYVPPPSSLRQLGDRIIDRSTLAAWTRSKLRPILNPSVRDNWAGRAVERHDTVAEEGLRAYRRNLESIIGMCRMHGVKVVMGTVGNSLDGNADWDPSAGTPNPLLYYHEGLTMAGLRQAFREYNRVNREVAASAGCPLVDLDSDLPVGKENYQDDVHYTAAGSAMVAKLFCDQVPWSEWVRE